MLCLVGFLRKCLCLVFLGFGGVVVELAFEIVSVEFEVGLSCLCKSVGGVSVEWFFMVFWVIVLGFIVMESISLKDVLFRQMVFFIIVV